MLVCHSYLWPVVSLSYVVRDGVLDQDSCVRDTVTSSAPTLSCSRNVVSHGATNAGDRITSGPIGIAIAGGASC